MFVDREPDVRTHGRSVFDNPGTMAAMSVESAQALTINRLFKSEFGEVRLIVKGVNAAEAKTLYTLCKIGMQAALDDAIHEVEEEDLG